VEITFVELGTAYGVFVYGTSFAVAVASYRRSRCLSGYPIWRSVIIAFLSASFQLLWLIVWWVNRKRIAVEWAHWQARRSRGHQALQVLDVEH
jgi:hypothetical protein